MHSYWSSRKKDTDHDQARNATSLINFQQGLQATENLNSSGKLKINLGRTNDRREAQELTTVAHVNEESTSTLATKSSSTTLLPVIALQFLKSSVSDPLASS